MAGSRQIRLTLRLFGIFCSNLIVLVTVCEVFQQILLVTLDLASIHEPSVRVLYLESSFTNVGNYLRIYLLSW